MQLNRCTREKTLSRVIFQKWLDYFIQQQQQPPQYTVINWCDSWYPFHWPFLQVFLNGRWHEMTSEQTYDIKVSCFIQIDLWIESNGLFSSFWQCAINMKRPTNRISGSDSPYTYRGYGYLENAWKLNEMFRLSLIPLNIYAKKINSTTKAGNSIVAARRIPEWINYREKSFRRVRWLHKSMQHKNRVCLWRFCRNVIAGKRRRKCREKKKRSENDLKIEISYFA